MGADIHPDISTPVIATGSYDRTVKLWKRGLLYEEDGDVDIDMA